MKKYLCFIVLIIVIVTSNLCFADNSKRIGELQEEQQRITQEIQSGQQYIQNKQIELFKNQGRISELQLLDCSFIAKDKSIEVGNDKKE